MVDSATQPLPCPTLAGAQVAFAFDAGRLSSDGGLPWLARADRALGLCAALAPCVPEWRHGPVHHSRETLVRQRVFQIACGYEDQNDADSLRSAPQAGRVHARQQRGSGRAFGGSDETATASHYNERRLRAEKL